MVFAMKRLKKIISSVRKLPTSCIGINQCYDNTLTNLVLATLRLHKSEFGNAVAVVKQISRLGRD